MAESFNTQEMTTWNFNTHAHCRNAAIFRPLINS